jgi:serine/threonine-protein kinase
VPTPAATPTIDAGTEAVAPPTATLPKAVEPPIDIEITPPPDKPPADTPPRDKPRRPKERPTPRERPPREIEREPREEPTPDDTPGWVSIDSDPYATIYVDGRKVGVTPLARIPLTPGSHRVRAVSSQGGEQTFSVSIESGKEARGKKLTW